MANKPKLDQTVIDAAKAHDQRRELAEDIQADTEAEIAAGAAPAEAKMVAQRRNLGSAPENRASVTPEVSSAAGVETDTGAKD